MYIILLKNNLTLIGNAPFPEDQCILSIPMTEEYDPAYSYQLLPNGSIVKTLIPEPKAEQPTTEDRVKLLEQQLKAASDQNEFLEDCITEMAGIVYA